LNKEEKKWKPTYKIKENNEITNKISILSYNILFYLRESDFSNNIKQIKENISKVDLSESKTKTKELNDLYQNNLKEFSEKIKDYKNLSMIIFEITKEDNISEEMMNLYFFILKNSTKEYIKEAYILVFQNNLKENTFKNNISHSKRISELFQKTISEKFISFEDGVALFSSASVSIITQINIDHEKRFERQLHLLSQENASIITLCEVRYDHIRKMMEEGWIRENYYISDITDGDDKLYNIGDTNYSKSHFTFVMTRIPFKKAEFMYIEGLTEPVINLELYDGLNVCSSHLPAYDHKHLIRRKIMKEIVEYFEKEVFILLGDLNIHNENDEKSIKELNFKDLFDFSKFEDIFTFDGLKNSLIHHNYLFCENRRMNLDRILINNIDKWNVIHEKYFAQNLDHEFNFHLSDHFGLFILLSKL
jgi:endonuclease/exonuclease/phosphatase family metal-dependent hydrolase